MRSLFLASAALLATLFVGVSAEAGFFGEAYIHARNAQVQVLKNGVWQKAVVGVDILLTDDRTVSTSSATLDGVTDFNQVASDDMPAPTNPGDVGRAFVGSGSVPGDNFGFSNVGSELSDDAYTYSDTTAVLNGTLVEIPGLTVDDSDVKVMASSLLEQNFQTSSAFSQIRSTSDVNIIALTTADFKLVFDYDVEVGMSLSTPPDFAQGTASAGFTVTGDPGAGATISENETFSMSFGESGHSFAGASFESGSITLLEGIEGGFTFSRFATLNMQAIPEPGSLAVFALSALGLCAAGYRRRRNA